MSHVISARIDNAIYQSIKTAAKKRKRKISEIIQDALEYYFDEYADYSVALERLNNHASKVISEKEMMKLVGITEDDLRD